MAIQEQTSGLGTPIKKRRSAQQPPPQQTASQHHSGQSAGIHPEDTPYSSSSLTSRQSANRTQKNKPTQRPQTTTEYEELDEIPEEELDDFTPTRMPTSARRYTNLPTDVFTFTQGGRRYIFHNSPPPQSLHRHLPPPEQYTQEEQEIIPQRRKTHFLVWVGIALLLMIFGWITLSALGAWVQAKQDDLVYGTTRHFTTDAVVGHHDSSSSPSHFIAENNSGNIIVIELPGGDSSKAKIYPITEVIGNQGNPPVRLVFQDVNRDRKLDMIVQIGDPGNAVTIMLFNNGAQFVSRL